MMFDFAIWSRNEPQRPILLVCEEAHRYIPSGADAEKSSVGRILSRIAKEGRKYGVSLGLITQRPSDLAEGALARASCRARVCKYVSISGVDVIVRKPRCVKSEPKTPVCVQQD